jgi:alanine racemase
VNGDTVIYILNALIPQTCGLYSSLNLRPVLGSREEISEWLSFCRQEGRAYPAALHIDTGMNRLGLSLEEGLAFAASHERSGLNIALLMSHFVSSEIQDDPLNTTQMERFETLCKAYPGIPCSLANSSGIFLSPKTHFDLVRPGYALYGGNPCPDQPNPMQNVIALKTRILQLRDVPTGARAGYNGQWTAPSPRLLATLSIGYADGYPRSASATDEKINHHIPAGEAVVAGIRCPFAGRVSMDLTIVDVTNVPRDQVKRGDFVTLIGQDLFLDEVAARAGTIGYEILTSLGHRYARIYT